MYRRIIYSAEPIIPSRIKIDYGGSIMDFKLILDIVAIIISFIALILSVSNYRFKRKLGKVDLELIANMHISFENSHIVLKFHNRSMYPISISNIHIQINGHDYIADKDTKKQILPFYILGFSANFIHYPLKGIIDNKIASNQEIIVDAHTARGNAHFVGSLKILDDEDIIFKSKFYS